MIRRVGERDERSGESPLGRLRHFISSLDKINLLTVVFLSATGLVFIYSTGIQAGYGAFFFRRQLIWLAVGFAAYFLCATPDPRRPGLRIAAVLFYLGSLVLLGAVLIPKVGIRVYGATRWIGFGSLRIQPSEFSKMALILALAAVFSSREFKIDRWSGILTGGIITAIPFALIVVEPDLGSALVCIPIFLAVLFCAGLKWRWIVVGILVVICICGAAVLNETMRIKPLLSNYQRNRILTFLDPERDRAGSGYNAYQAKLAVGSGGLTGKGIGDGTPNTLGFLPQTVANNDFIFSVIAEETGFFGALALITGYMLLFYSLLRTAFAADGVFGRLLCSGTAAMLFTHVFVNIGMSIGITPITGLSLPLVSRGGSFTVITLALLGLAQAVRRHGEEVF